MGKPNKKLGKYATVSVKLGHVSNKPMWSETKGAGYRAMRESFTVIDRTVDIVGGKEKVSLILTHAEHDGKTFTAAPGMCRLLRAGPPNMRFCDAPSAAAAPAVLPATVTATMPAQVVGPAVATGLPIPSPMPVTLAQGTTTATATNDFESDPESVDSDDEADETSAEQVAAALEAAEATGGLDFGNWQAATDAHTVDARIRPRVPPSLIAHIDPSALDELAIFRLLIPEEFIKSKIIPLTSTRLATVRMDTCTSCGWCPNMGVGTRTENSHQSLRHMSNGLVIYVIGMFARTVRAISLESSVVCAGMSILNYKMATTN